ncbi:DUF742 domain-containing protein [Thermoactinospora rubra]|uniref:DUF742 domain-containing protein n=1 Tax=Thermoactinospora rubra TaxID=1088767 RepID=UPI000A0F7D53|nr:DUF742 domain-containing protein [Thermoactinospora rubra]
MSEEWVDEPVVRPYALTRGRTAPSPRAALDLLATVVRTAAPAPDSAELGVHHRRLLERLAEPRRVVEVASDMGLPVGVVRVLLGDLLEHKLITVRQTAPSSTMESLLREVIDGLRAL